jgi:GNAT superfamily N-acetyltransferase
LHARKGSGELVEELLVRGFAPKPDLPCMELDPHAALPHPAPGLRVRNVTDARTLADLQRVAFESFGYPLASARAALTDALIAMPHVTFFVGYLDERPVCSAGLIFTGDVAGIYWVGTLAPRRKLGLGAAITAHAAQEARLRGLSRVCLQASQLGAPVYRRLGFRETHAYLRFSHA